ncbi:MAG: Helicase associated domain protein [Chthoniobacterales bacterium]|nr:Helicase associated domain protein [Chthoniobacterales bacterium]
MNLPRHPKAKHFHGLGLMSGVQIFAELEERIAALPTEQARGAALEVFAEACLATQRIYQARDVWPGNSMPSSLRQQLRLPLADMGVDGVFVSSVEEPVCYQSKFRTGRPALTWTELSTFYGLADVGARRLVFTNCDEVARVAEERLGAIFVRGSDLDRLTPEDFQIIEAWLAERAAAPKRKHPKPHQVVALNDIVGGLARGPRATALMACGSGKTLVALWAAERLGARTVLVLLPSLALVRQTLHEWLHETSWPDVQFLCVCSDPTVQPEEDSLLVRPSDLDFAVTTQATDVRRFLERQTDSVRLVFSTYQSSQVVAAAVAGLPPFDFGVFDEAHKTAGRDGARFALALKDENLPIARRLFMTATPRHYDVAKKDKFGESKVVFSMNVPETYGQVVHRLPFNAAAKAGIITDYKVLISVVTSEMVTNEALRLGVVLVEGDEVKARQVANQIALKSAIEKYKVSKVFTFHSKVNSAKSFTSGGPEGIGTHLKGFHCAHIEGAMTTVYRERLLREFAAAPRAILSNARCLTEGVDVPAVDMVAFLSPKRSIVDIVQATGRAMRRSPEKEIGYVLVPLYVEEARGETTEQAVLRSNFDEVWRVLQSLKEQDDLLAQTIAEMRIERGCTGGFDDSRFRERVEIFGPELSLEVLRSTITAACLDAVGEPWFERYGQLVAYKQKHGDCGIPARWDAHQKLATWVVDQRVRKRDGNLEPEKVELLNRLGFNWNPRETNWRGAYLELVKFQKRFGHCRVPQNWKENNSLAHWVKTQRMDFLSGELHGDRIALLEKIGFDWKVDRSTWEKRFADLCAFKERFGHTRVNVQWAENGLLGRWVVRQRHQHKKGKLSDALVERLNSIGFEWDGRTAASRADEKTTDPDKQWRVAFDRFRAYAAAHGAAAVYVVDEDTKKLNRWMLTQRQAKKRGELSETRINALNEIGFVWQRNARRIGMPSQLIPVDETPITRTWDEMLSELVDFFKLHGHCNVPADWTPQPQLARWVAIQRRAKKQNQLTPEQVSRMEEIGFAWSTHDGAWDAMFAKLVEHMRPMHNGKRREAPASDELKRWMLTQRQSKKRGDLEPEREKRLTGIGFEWEPFASRWNRMLGELKRFHAEHGHCRVPAAWSKNPVLANWVGVQRARKLDGKLSPERIAALDALGFAWRLGEFSGTRSPQEAWNTMLKRLIAFHAEHGHAAVPQVYRPDKKLGWWVTTQRRKYRKQKLADWQIARLNELAFDWDGGRKGGRPRTHMPKPSNGERPLSSVKYFEMMFQALLEYKQAHGDCLVPQRWKENRKLADWVSEQRMAYSRERLAPDRVQRLNDAGFEWDPIGTRWEEMFRQLVEFKKEHGHTNVPQRSGKYAALGTWVRSQRAAKRYNRPIIAKRSKRLDEIGFSWRLVERNAWDRMFDRLVEFKKLHGHCNVPQKGGGDKLLGRWVNTQRTHFKIGTLKPNRVQQLQKVGFVWNTKASRG